MSSYQPFIGFTYNGKHSIEDLHIYRTSNGNRYDENLTPTMTDKVVDVPGGDGQYYFGTTFKNRTFTVNYAFDNLKKVDITEMKRVFSGDGIHELIFDEDRDEDGNALKIWSAKVTGTATMKHLCFEEDGEDIYKGEGSITFTCYYPYARSKNNPWYSGKEVHFKTTNEGDLPAPFSVTITHTAGDNGSTITGLALCPQETKDVDTSSTSSARIVKASVMFSNPKTVGKNESITYKWDSKTGLVSEKDGDKWSIVPLKSGGVYLVPPGEVVWVSAHHPFMGYSPSGLAYNFYIKDHSAKETSCSEFRELYR